MTTGHTTEECLDAEHEDDHEVTEAAAERRGRTPADVQRLLKARGIHACTIHTVKLFGDGEPFPWENTSGTPPNRSPTATRDGRSPR
jgi:hypothetical protein